MHADAVHRGGMFIWKTYLPPAPELLARYDRATTHTADWSLLEPNFTP